MTITPSPQQLPQAGRPMLPAARPSSGAAAPTMTARDVFRTLLKHIYLVTLLPLGMTILAGVATSLWLKYSPMYTATALVEVLPPAPPPTKSSDPAAVSREIMDRLLISTVRMVKTEEVMAMAMQKDEMKRTKWYAANQANQDAPQRLLKQIDVTPMGGTDLISISMTGKDKADIRDVVNAVTIAAVEDYTKRIEASRKTDADSINRNLNEAKQDVLKAQDKIKAAGGRLLPLMDVNRALNNDKGRMDAMIDQLKMEIGVLEAYLNDLKTKDMTNLQRVQMALDNDPMLRSLKLAEANGRTERQRIELKFGRESRQWQANEAILANLQKQIEEVTRLVTASALDQLRAEAESQLAGKMEAMQQENSQREVLLARVADLGTRIQQAGEGEREEQIAADRVRTYQNSLNDLGAVNVNRLLLGRIAQEPTEPSMPKWSIMLPLGLLLGLLLGFGLAFLLEFMDSSVKSSSDITRRVDLPVLGMIPHLDDIEDDVPDIRLAFMTNPNSLVGESFRQVRTNLLFSGPAQRLKSLLVTSPMPEDGRTTVTMNLAGSMSRSGRKVLVVDANFRQPAIRKLFPQCKDVGLSNALVGQAPWQELVVQIEPNLWVMPSGPLPPNPAELLGSDQMRQMIAQMCEQYDQVLFDAAPGLVVSDPAVLSTLTDGVVMVVRAGTNTYGVVQRTRDMLQKVGGRVVGAVLNGVRATAGGYLRKSYETFYDYHEQAQLPGKS